MVHHSRAAERHNLHGFTGMRASPRPSVGGDRPAFFAGRRSGSRYRSRDVSDPPAAPQSPAPGPRGSLTSRLRVRFPTALIANTVKQLREAGLPIPFDFHRPDSTALVDEQIQYVQSLWDRIAASPEQVPVPGGTAKSERAPKDYQANPDSGESWDVVRERLRDKLNKPRATCR